MGQPSRGRRRGVPGAAVLLTGVALLLGGCTSPAAAPSPTGGATPTAQTSRPTAGTVRSTPAGSAATTAPPATTVVTSSAPAGSAPGVPEVVRLAWLDGDQGDTGLVVDDPAGGRRWYAPTPGEQAVRTGQGYRWFGADGAAVGCVAPRRCVGFDADGMVAVVDGSALDTDYRPDATPAGWFDAGGRQRSGPAQPTLAQALAAAGLDLAGLVQADGRRVPFAGGVTGDPHLVTGGGRRYSVQYTGDFDARSGDDDRRVQLRWEPLPYLRAVSVTTAVAVGASGTVVTADQQGTVAVGGRPVVHRDSFQRVRIGSATWVGVWPIAADGTSALVVAWPDGGTVSVRTDPSLGLTVVVHAPRRADVRGLFGTGDTTSQDLVDRDGIALDTQSVVMGWNVPAGADLFPDAGPRPLGFPAGPAAPSDRAAGFATSRCRAAGVVQADLAGCVFDVALTGDDRFVTGHALLSRAATAAVPRALAQRWPAMADLAPASAQRLPELLQATPGRGEQDVWSVPVGRTGPLRLVFVSGCPAAVDEALAVDRPALRVFDDAGRPVSDRIPACGEATTPELPPGRYRLVVAGPLSGEPRPVRVEVSVP